MKKRYVKEISLKDVKTQIIVGIVLVLLILVLGFVFINNKIQNACATSSANLEGDLNAMRAVSDIRRSPDRPSACTQAGEKCTVSGNPGLCCYDLKCWNVTSISQCPKVEQASP